MPEFRGKKTLRQTQNLENLGVTQRYLNKPYFNRVHNLILPGILIYLPLALIIKPSHVVQIIQNQKLLLSAWSNYRFYSFVPFSIISLVLQKFEQEQSIGIIVVPTWPTQTWWPVAMKMLVQAPVVLPATERTLYLSSHPTEKRPLHHKLSLLMWHLSRNNSKTEAFLQQLPISWQHLRDQGPGSKMKALYQHGSDAVVKGKLIYFRQLSQKLKIF